MSDIQICAACKDPCEIFTREIVDYEPFGSTYEPRYTYEDLSKCCQVETYDATTEDILRYVERNKPKDLEHVRFEASGECIHIVGTDSEDDIHIEDIVDMGIDQYFNYVREETK
jgi:hypothetical protein